MNTWIELILFAVALLLMVTLMALPQGSDARTSPPSSTDLAARPGPPSSMTDRR